MKRTLISVMIIMVVCFGFATPGFSADVAKIGTFHLQKILDESSAGKLIKKQLKAKFEELQEKLKKEKEEIEEMKKALEREALVLSAEKSDEKKRAFRIRVTDYKEMQNSFARDMKMLEGDFRKKILEDIFEIVEKLGKEEGYMLILEKKTAGVFYNQPNLDITDKIIKLYNLKTSKNQ